MLARIFTEWRDNGYFIMNADIWYTPHYDLIHFRNPGLGRRRVAASPCQSVISYLIV